jgi:hypothetical protein
MVQKHAGTEHSDSSTLIFHESGKYERLPMMNNINQGIGCSELPSEREEMAFFR